MCMFSQPVEEVANTRIFARAVNGRQFLLYGMNYVASDDLAMVLPLPVLPNSPEDAVRFISLEGYSDFFDDLDSAFGTRGVGQPNAHSLGVSRAPLKVHDVGRFEASFVPQLEDFDRLDERFRLPSDIWRKLPIYTDYGFAVFKLKGSSRRLDVHPMALEFPRLYTELLYFPTVHIHDRQVHPHADFDHMLYWQVEPELVDVIAPSGSGYVSSGGGLSWSMDLTRTEGIIHPDLPCYRCIVKGRRENRDALLGETGSFPAAA